MPKTKVYVGGLVDDVGNDRLHRTFEKFGNIKKVWVARNQGSRGYAFIDFYNQEHALNASVEMNGKHVFGSNIKVELSNNGIDDNKYSDRHKSDRDCDDRRGDRSYDDRRGDRSYDDRRGDRNYDDWRGDRDRDRRRSDRDRDNRARRSPPPYYKRRSNDEDDDDSRLAPLSHIHPAALPRTINIIKQLERVTRLRLERELLEKFRRSSESVSDTDPKDKLSSYLSRYLEERNTIPYSSRSRDPVNDESFKTSVDSIFRDHHIEAFNDERPMMFDSKQTKLYPQCSNHERGHSRSLLPTPNFPKLKNSQGHHSFHGSPHFPPPWHIPNDNGRTPLTTRPQPYGNARIHNGHQHNDWHNKQYVGFGPLPISARPSANKQPITPQLKVPHPPVPPVKGHEPSDIVDTS